MGNTAQNDNTQVDRPFLDLGSFFGGRKRKRIEDEQLQLNQPYPAPQLEPIPAVQFGETPTQEQLEQSPELKDIKDIPPTPSMSSIPDLDTINDLNEPETAALGDTTETPSALTLKPEENLLSPVPSKDNLIENKQENNLTSLQDEILPSTLLSDASSKHDVLLEKVPASTNTIIKDSSNNQTKLTSTPKSKNTLTNMPNKDINVTDEEIKQRTPEIAEIDVELESLRAKLVELREHLTDLYNIDNITSQLRELGSRNLQLNDRRTKLIEETRNAIVIERKLKVLEDKDVEDKDLILRNDKKREELVSKIQQLDTLTKEAEERISQRAMEIQRIKGVSTVSPIQATQLQELKQQENNSASPSLGQEQKIEDINLNFNGANKPNITPVQQVKGPGLYGGILNTK